MNDVSLNDGQVEKKYSKYAECIIDVSLNDGQVEKKYSKYSECIIVSF